ncbi:MAG: uracil-DNA glycosylase family protein [Burkholderiales bacterium]
MSSAISFAIIELHEEALEKALELADPSWRPILRRGLEAIADADQSYFPALMADHYLPTGNRLFAAFAQPLERVRYVLVGEGPYPRSESATGFCFMDGAVGDLWSESGLSKQVNRATSLRNFMKMLLVADKQLVEGHTSGPAMEPVARSARLAGSPMIQTLADLHDNLTRQGFLLLNAALAFRPHVPPVKEAKAWRPFLQTVLAALAASAECEVPPTLVLWGKIAEQLQALPTVGRFPQAISEHPYNLSFIANPLMQNLFGAMHLLQKEG